MQIIVLGLLQVIAASGILYGYYHFFLRNKQFHQYNRFYLLGTVVISLIIPFLRIPIHFSGNSESPSRVFATLQTISANDWEQPVVVSAVKSGSAWDWNQFLWITYAVIAFVLLVRVILSLRKIIILKNKHRVEKLDGIQFVNTNEPGTPFSFFRWLFWHRKIELNSARGEQIFRHEVYHIQQKHSWDVMFLEAAAILCWVNPFFIVIRRELKAIHEFLADRFAVNEKEHWNYAELLLMQALETRQSLVNPFFHNQIKRRIAMITNSKKTSHRYLRKLLVLPVAALVLTLFAFRYQKVTEETIPTPDSSIEINEVPANFDGTDAENSQAIQSYSPSRSINGVRMDTLKPTVKEVRGYNSQAQPTMLRLRGVAGTQVQPLFVLDGVIVESKNEISVMDTLQPERIQSITVLKDASASKYGAQGVNGVVEITTKPGIQIKEVPAMEFKPPAIQKTNDLNEVVVVGYAKYPPASEREFVKAEIDPSFPGGQSAWLKYLQRNLNGNTPIDNKAPVGNYTVYVQFIVASDGAISDIKALTNHGYGMEQEAVRVIKEGPKWVPAQQNGKAVDAYRRQPITFMIISAVEAAPSVVEEPKTNTTIAVTPSKSSLEEVTVTGYPKSKTVTSSKPALEEVTVTGYPRSKTVTPSKPALEEVTVTGYSKSNTPLKLTEQVSAGDIPLIYPNPSSQQAIMVVNSDNGGPAAINVLDLNGKVISNRTITLVKGRNTVTVNTSDLAKGTYIVRVIENGKKASASKLIKE